MTTADSITNILNAKPYYLKSTDNLGIETMRTYNIAEVENKEETNVETV